MFIHSPLILCKKYIKYIGGTLDAEFATLFFFYRPRLFKKELTATAFDCIMFSMISK
ncbi:hypothetical protein B4098_3194 [Heyndrickxia coagulans]|uniref:Uncharacterized protein n=1 Tax=Heyndrickxia coagulans TaxID=1398 RepID=A0A150K4W7_HEYCO|nr:hypothetical protein B4098_3194 [Heyndrickxia coagulans]